jgi:hypothetical protein
MERAGLTPQLRFNRVVEFGHRLVKRVKMASIFLNRNAVWILFFNIQESFTYCFKEEDHILLTFLNWEQYQESILNGSVLHNRSNWNCVGTQVCRPNKVIEQIKEKIANCCLNELVGIYILVHGLWEMYYLNRKIQNYESNGICGK